MTDEEILELYAQYHIPVFSRETTEKYNFCNIQFTGVGCGNCKIAYECVKKRVSPQYPLPRVSKAVADGFRKEHPEYYI